MDGGVPMRSVLNGAKPFPSRCGTPATTRKGPSPTLRLRSAGDRDEPRVRTSRHELAAVARKAQATENYRLSTTAIQSPTLTPVHTCWINACSGSDVQRSQVGGARKGMRPCGTP